MPVLSNKACFFSLFIAIFVSSTHSFALDFDRNGFSDVWEWEYNVTQDLVLDEDADQDGKTNFQESLDLTNPFDFNDKLQIHGFFINTQNLTINFDVQVKANISYDIYYSEDNENWTYYQTIEPTVNGDHTVSVPFNPSVSNQSWRAEVGSDNDFTSDSDSDGITDWEEDKFGTRSDKEDSDDDGYTDLQEIVLGTILGYPLDPSVGNSPGIEIDHDSDLLPDLWELEFGTNITIDDSEIDSEEDLLTNYEEYSIGTHPFKIDSDSDGLIDYYENLYPIFAPNTAPNPGPNALPEDDYDGDLLTNYQENEFLTNPMLADSDNDTYNDKLELDTGSDPNNPASTPPPPNPTPTPPDSPGKQPGSGRRAIEINSNHGELKPVCKDIETPKPSESPSGEPSNPSDNPTVTVTPTLGPTEVPTEEPTKTPEGITLTMSQKFPNTVIGKSFDFTVEANDPEVSLTKISLQIKRIVTDTSSGGSTSRWQSLTKGTNGFVNGTTARVKIGAPGCMQIIAYAKDSDDELLGPSNIVNAELRFPTGKETLTNSKIQKMLREVWIVTKLFARNNAPNVREHGVGIQYDSEKEEYFHSATQEGPITPPGDLPTITFDFPAENDLFIPPTKFGRFNVTSFHTHPPLSFKPGYSRVTGPSPNDLKNAKDICMPDSAYDYKKGVITSNDPSHIDSWVYLYGIQRRYPPGVKKPSECN